MRISQFKKKYLSSDKRTIKKKYKQVFGFEPNLKNPKRFTEIINWCKLHIRTKLMTQCSDKLAVRGYVKDKIGEEYLVPLLAYGKTWDSINFTQLESPFIIKTNHGSGGNKIVYDISKLDHLASKNQFSDWLRENYYCGLREWQYKNIKPQILVEKLLMNSENEIPDDYKFYCFNYGSEIELIIEITRGRFKQIKRAFYTEDWTKLPTQVAFPMCIEELKPPENFKLMCDLTRKLAKPFKYVRVDLYNVDGEIFFGELTFSPFSGLMKITPDEWDFVLGEKLLKTGVLNQ